jgi:hypothetical protein
VDFVIHCSGGEGLFYALITGPGLVYLQSVPFSRMADRIVAASRVGGGREESRGLGGLFGWDDQWERVITRSSNNHTRRTRNANEHEMRKRKFRTASRY